MSLNTFENIAREWHDKFKERGTEKNAKVILARMQRDIFPHIGSIPIRDLKAPDLLALARRIEARGALDYAHRALQYCAMVFRYAIATGRSEHNIERQLAHGERNAVRTAYNFAEFLPERRKMMQSWADYTDQLRAE